MNFRHVVYATGTAFIYTEGWTRDDGRTVFCVGDPMQSIYRFREPKWDVFGTTAHGLPNVRSKRSAVCELSFNAPV